MNQHRPIPLSRDQLPNRPQTAYGNNFMIRDASDFVDERPSFHQPDIDVIDTENLFLKDEVVIWVWRPNVFTLIPNKTQDQWDSNEHIRYAAKSLYRAPSKIEDTKGRVQSSIFFILKNLSEENIERLRVSAQWYEWSTDITCVRSNMKVFHEAGFTLWNWESLESIVWPWECFEKIIEHGLSIDDERVEIENLKTSKRYLEQQVFQTKKSVMMTPIRHLKRWLTSKGVLRKDSTPKIQEVKVKAPSAPVMIHQDHHMSDITLTSANTPKISRHFRRLWWAHGVLWIDQDRVNIEDYLTEELKAYPQKKPSFATRLKKHVLYNKTVVGFLNSFIQKWHSDFPNKSEADLHTLFETHSEQRPCKYNVVSWKNGSKLMKIDIEKASVDWVLTKHVLISNYDPNIMFAGEVWKDVNGTVWVNRNSGTYAPSERQLDNFIKYLQAVFPNVDIRADYKI